MAPRTRRSLVIKSCRGRISVCCFFSAAGSTSFLASSASACRVSVMAVTTASRVARNALPPLEIMTYVQVTSSSWRKASGLSRTTSAGMLLVVLAAAVPLTVRSRLRSILLTSINNMTQFLKLVMMQSSVVVVLQHAATASKKL